MYQPGPLLNHDVYHSLTFFGVLGECISVKDMHPETHYNCLLYIYICIYILLCNNYKGGCVAFLIFDQWKCFKGDDDDGDDNKVM